ncbi:TIM barrel protein [Muricauda sp. SCSIO 64092]|uniref:hydroxypyruvate isomerase family protein n=1 Tax=Allomuricauda sp. SCSIO 64092 TaxID=2908842 RepID=UPI001FF6533D|nr:TIM barrel protein [Muricauda sp. SCSIO 64092]UOY04956.1 TIM barrel protein [Muricauda sp. SCSIO 64092]
MESKERRSAIKKIIATSGTIVLGDVMKGSIDQTKTSKKMEIKKLKENINHAVCKWCYPDIPLDEFSEKAKDIGIKGIDLLRPDEWHVAKKHGLICSMGTDFFASIKRGFNDKGNHASLISNYEGLIKKAADNGIQQVIVFSGDRKGINDDEGWDNCAKGLEPLVKLAEKLGVTLTMELLNSKVNHKDYQCDHTLWGVELVNKIGSPNFKLLYDIYHMQIMEGDIIATIQNYHDYFSHYHTGGVPGRNEINDSQELNYTAIMEAIQKTGYTGFVAQEFIPTYEDKMVALAEGIRICDV